MIRSPSARLALAVLVAAIGWAGPVALAGAGGPVSELLGSSCASAAGTNHVGVVIDFSGARATSRGCASTGGTDDGFAALHAAGHTVRVSPSGLLCAIDGYPATGCGELTGGHYSYWSYWHAGSDRWIYSSVGPAGVRPKDGSVEGWHYIVDGGGNPTDPPPASSWTSPCPTAPPPTATTEPPGGGSGGGSGGGGGAAGGGGGSGPSPTTAAPNGAMPDVTATTTLDAAGDPTVSPSSTVDGSTGDEGSASTVAGSSDEAALGETAPASSHRTGGVPVGVIVITLVVVLLLGSAFVRGRVRPPA